MKDGLKEQGFDRESAFLIYCNFAGDIERSALALGIRSEQMLRVVEEEGWLQKLEPVLRLVKSSRKGDLEKALNRTQNFVQCQRFKNFLGRVIHRLCGMDDAELEEYLLTANTAKDGSVTKKLSTRALADAASALEKIHSMSYQALGDTSAERMKRKADEEQDISAIDIHQAISDGFSRVRASNTPRAMLLDSQLEQANQIVEERRTPANPNDNDDH